MQFGKPRTIMPFNVSDNLAERLYGDSPKLKDDYVLLDQLCNVFKNRIHIHPQTKGRNFTCYIEKKAFDAFVNFANRTYLTKNHEATGLIVGYYLHDANYPEQSFIIGTHFLEAHGQTSSVTCEISYEDASAHNLFYEEHKLLPVVWIHSHPGFGVFYSSTDRETLKKCYFAPHQTGVVVDNLQNQILGFKMYGNRQEQENIYIFDLEKSNESHLHFVYNNWVRNSTYQKSSSKSSLTFFEDKEPHETDEIAPKENKILLVENESNNEKEEANVYNETSEKECLINETDKKRTFPIKTILCFIALLMIISFLGGIKIMELEHHIGQMEQSLKSTNEAMNQIKSDVGLLRGSDSTLYEAALLNNRDSLIN